MHKVRYQKTFRGRRGFRKMWITASEHETEEEAYQAGMALSKANKGCLPIQTLDSSGNVVLDTHLLVGIFGVKK